MTDRKRQLEGIAKQIQGSKHYQGRAYLSTDVPPYVVLPTGSLALDYVTGVGGLPVGILVELFGPPGVGKTTLTYYMMKQAQLAGKAAGYVGLEGIFDKGRAQDIAGVDPDNVLEITPVSGSDAAEALYIMVNSGEIGFVAFDSIGAFNDASEQESGVAKVGGAARSISLMVNRVVRPAWKNQCTVVFVNQIRSAMNPRNPAAVTTPGGKALEHAVALRIQLKSAWGALDSTERQKYMGEIDGEKAKLGDRVAATTMKNKAGSFAGRTAQFDLWWMPPEGISLGIDPAPEAFDLASRLGLIVRGGAYYSHPTFSNKIQGRENVISFIRDNPKSLAAIRDEIILANRCDAAVATNGKVHL